MTHRVLAVLIACAGVLLSTQGAVQSAEHGTENPMVAKVQVVAAEAPSVILWKTSARPTEAIRLAESEGRSTVAAGEGCLVAVRQGSAPVSNLLKLAPGEVKRLEVGVWEPGVLVSGQVTSSTGGAVVARAALERPNAGGTTEDPCALALREGGVTAGSTDDGGSFVLGPVAPGTYTLTVAADGYEPVERKVVLGREPTAKDLGEVVLDPVAEIDLSFDLSEVEESPPFGLAVSRRAEGYFGLQSREWSKVRDLKLEDDAPMQLSLPPGLYRLAFSKEGTDVRFVQELLLSPGLNFVRLRPWPIKVHGSVYRGAEPVEGADVLFICSGAETSATTSEDGEYDVRVWTAAVCGVRARAGDGGGVATSIDLTEADFGDDVTLDLEIPDNLLEGTVVDASTLEPIPDARVRVSQVKSDRSGQMSWIARTDDTGAFEFNSLLGDSPRTLLNGDAGGYSPASREIQVAKAGPTMVQLELHRTAGVTGRIVGPGGEAVSGAVVGCCAVDPTQPFSVTATTDARGEFELDAPPGSVLYACAVGYTVGWAPASEPDEETVIRLGSRAYPARLRLVDGEGAPVGGSPLYFGAATGAILGRGLLGTDAVMNRQRLATDQDGTLMTASLPPGLYQVLAFSPLGFVQVGQVAVPFSGEATLHLPADEGTE